MQIVLLSLVISACFSPWYASAQAGGGEGEAAVQLCRITGWCLSAREGSRRDRFTFVGPRGLSYTTATPRTLLESACSKGRVKMVPGGIVFPDFEMQAAESVAAALSLNVLCVEDLFGVICEFTDPASAVAFWTWNNVSELEDLVQKNGAAQVSISALDPEFFAAADELARTTGWTRDHAVFSGDAIRFRFQDSEGNLFETSDPARFVLQVNEAGTPDITGNGHLHWGPASSCAKGLKPDR